MRSWFHHPDNSTEEAEELTRQYHSRNIKTEKHLSADYTSWTVSALLPESEHEPVPSRRWAQPIWSRI